MSVKPFSGIDEAAGLEILELIRDEGKAKDQLYRVRMLCCGAEVELTRLSIFLRRAKRRRRCMACIDQRKDGLSVLMDDDKALAAGVIILEVVRRAQYARDNVYRVEMTCCGDVRELRHDWIAQRALHGYGKCQSCNGEDKLDKPLVMNRDKPRYTWLHGVAPPTWPKPPSVPTGKAVGIWGNR